MGISPPPLEISEKAHKSLITCLPAGRQGLWADYTDMKDIEK
jgi:hypothetical protein